MLVDSDAGGAIKPMPTSQRIALQHTLTILKEKGKGERGEVLIALWSIRPRFSSRSPKSLLRELCRRGRCLQKDCYKKLHERGKKQRAESRDKKQRTENREQREESRGKRDEAREGIV
jgi:hypothetical protein